MLGHPVLLLFLPLPSNNRLYVRGRKFTQLDDGRFGVLIEGPAGYSYTYNRLYQPLEWVFTENHARPCYR